MEMIVNFELAFLGFIPTPGKHKLFWWLRNSYDDSICLVNGGWSNWTDPSPIVCAATW